MKRRQLIVLSALVLLVSFALSSCLKGPADPVSLDLISDSDPLTEEKLNVGKSIPSGEQIFDNVPPDEELPDQFHKEFPDAVPANFETAAGIKCDWKTTIDVILAELGQPGHISFTRDTYGEKWWTFVWETDNGGYAETKSAERNNSRLLRFFVGNSDGSMAYSYIYSELGAPDEVTDISLIKVGMSVNELLGVLAERSYAGGFSQKVSYYVNDSTTRNVFYVTIKDGKVDSITDSGVSMDYTAPIETLRSIKAGMTFDEVVDLLGRPLYDPFSGRVGMLWRVGEEKELVAVTFVKRVDNPETYEGPFVVDQDWEETQSA